MVLLIYDNANALLLWQKTLEKLGVEKHKIITATSINEGLNILRSQKDDVIFDMVIIEDKQMTKKPCDEMLKIFNRKLPETKIPKILLTTINSISHNDNITSISSYEESNLTISSLLKSTLSVLNPDDISLLQRRILMCSEKIQKSDMDSEKCLFDLRNFAVG